MTRRARPSRLGIVASLGAVAIGFVFAGSGPAQVGVTVDPNPNPNGAGWHNEPFTVTFTHAVLTCDPPQPGYNGPDDANPSDITSTCTDPADPDVLPPETGTYSFKYDASPPTVDINPPNGSGPVHTQPFNVTLAWNAAVSGEAQGCPTSVTYSGGQQDVACTDGAGNTRTVTLSYPYDDSAPSVSIDSGPANGSISGDRNPTFTFSSNDQNTVFRCEIDAGGFVPCTSPRQLALGDGSHTFSVYAIDQAGLQSAPESRTWQILQVPQNTTPPTIVGFPGEAETLAADQGQWIGGTPVTTLLTHWQSCDAGGGGCSDIGTGPTYLVKAADVGRRIRVRVEANNPATEALGNPIFAESELTAVVTPLNRDLPLTTILSRPRNPTNRQRAVFTFESSRAGSTFQCSLDNGPFQPCVSGRTYVGLAAGLHTFGVKATFQAGNGEIFHELSPAAWVWRIDLVRPPPPTNVLARGGDAKVFLFWSPPRVADVAATRVARKRVNSLLLPPVVRSFTGTRFTDRTVKNRVLYRYSLKTRDRAGNLSVGKAVYARPRDPLLSPRDGAIVTGNPLLDWVSRPHATYYNVQVHRVVADGPDVKVLTTWPVASRYQIPRHWFYLRWRSLNPGVYIWRVWPGFGNPANEQYGRMIGSSVFTKR